MYVRYTIQFLFFFSLEKKTVDKDISLPQQTGDVPKNVSPCKSDDSRYGSGNAFEENPKVETLVSNLNQDFIEKKSIGRLGRESANFKAVRSRINRNLFM